MNQIDLLNKLKAFGLNTKKEYMAEAFSRNIGLLTESEQETLAKAKVAIPGMGGVGGIHLVTLVRTGVTRFNLADFDFYEPLNVNRQFGARVPDFGRPKLEVMKKQALSINPYLEIKEFPCGINGSNIDDFLDGVQVVIDSLDFFNFNTRRLLFNKAREKGVYVVTAGPIGFSSALLIFSPYKGMSFDEYFNIVEGMAPIDQHIAFAVGLAPKATQFKYMDLSKVNTESKAGPSLAIACKLCAGMATVEAIRIILKKGDIKPVPYFFQFDPYVQKYCKGRLFMGNRNPIQKLKIKVVKFRLKRNESLYNPFCPELPQKPATSSPVPEEVIHYIIRAGIQAPSGDNAQPWKFSYHGNTVFLYLDRDADRSFFNTQQIASIISCGAVLENIRIAASAFGLQARISNLPTIATDNLMVSLEFIDEKIEKDPLFDSIWRRHTNRKLYNKKPIQPSVLDDLRKSISGFPGAKLHFITDKTDLKRLAKMVYRVDRIRTEHRPLHEHLCSMIRFTHKEAITKRNGLPLKNLEAGLAGEIFLKATRPWQIMNIVNRIGLGRMVAFHSHKGIINASGAALLTIDSINSQAFLKGGQALERIWLTITQKAMFMQPMTAITLFWLRWKLEGKKSFSKNHRKLFKNVWQDYQALFPNVNFDSDGHVILFRFGIGKEIKYGTHRKNLESFLNGSCQNKRPK